MYSGSLYGIGEFIDFEYHIELDPNKLRLQILYKAKLSVELRLKGKIQLENKVKLINL